MNYLHDLSVFHYDGKEIPCIVNKGAPTHQTEGATGSLYMDSGSGNLYKCVAVDPQSKTYNWVIIGAADEEEIRLAVESFFTRNPVSAAGLTSVEKNLMLALFKAVPYQTDVSATMKSLEAIWSSSSGGDEGGDDSGVTYYAVAYNLTGLTADNSASSVVSGSSLTVNLTPDTNAVLGEAVVTMGGVDVTDTVYSNGKISISSVTGDVVITATAAAAAYTQVEYLESTNNDNGISTGYILSSTDLVEIEFSNGVSTTNWAFPFGACTGNAVACLTTRFDGVAGRTSFTRRGNGAYTNRNAADADFVMPKTIGVVYRLAETEPGTAALYDADGNILVTLVDESVSGWVDPASVVGLFAFFEKDTPRANTGGVGLRIHSFKVKNAYGNTVVDMIPVLDENDVACMYDKVSGEFLYGANGNDYTAGGVV